jgi:F0F1-type ATP synthase membrane subunit b/b'
VNEAKVRIEAETVSARRTLADSAGLLADQIADQVLARRVS